MRHLVGGNMSSFVALTPCETYVSYKHTDFYFLQTDCILPPLEGLVRRNPISQLHDHILIILALQMSPFPLWGDHNYSVELYM